MGREKGGFSLKEKKKRKRKAKKRKSSRIKIIIERTSNICLALNKSQSNFSPAHLAVPNYFISLQRGSEEVKPKQRKNEKKATDRSTPHQNHHLFLLQNQTLEPPSHRKPHPPHFPPFLPSSPPPSPLTILTSKTSRPPPHSNNRITARKFSSVSTVSLGQIFPSLPLPAGVPLSAIAHRTRISLTVSTMERLRYLDMNSAQLGEVVARFVRAVWRVDRVWVGEVRRTGGWIGRG